MSDHEVAAEPGSSRVVVPDAPGAPQRAAKMTVMVRRTKRRRKPQGDGVGEPERNDDVSGNEVDRVSAAITVPAAQPPSPAAEAPVPRKKLLRTIMVCRRVRRRKSHSAAAAAPVPGGEADGESPSSLTPQPTEPEQQQQQQQEVPKDLSMLPIPVSSPTPSVTPRRHHRHRHHRTATAPHVKLPTANEAPLVAIPVVAGVTAADAPAAARSSTGGLVEKQQCQAAADGYEEEHSSPLHRQITKEQHNLRHSSSPIMAVSSSSYHSLLSSTDATSVRNPHHRDAGAAAVEVDHRREGSYFSPHQVPYPSSNSRPRHSTLSLSPSPTYVPPMVLPFHAHPPSSLSSSQQLMPLPPPAVMTKASSSSQSRRLLFLDPAPLPLVPRVVVYEPSRRAAAAASYYDSAALNRSRSRRCSDMSRRCPYADGRSTPGAGRSRRSSHISINSSSSSSSSDSEPNFNSTSRRRRRRMDGTLRAWESVAPRSTFFLWLSSWCVCCPSSLCAPKRKHYSSRKNDPLLTVMGPAATDQHPLMSERQRENEAFAAKSMAIYTRLQRNHHMQMVPTTVPGGTLPQQQQRYQQQQQQQQRHPHMISMSSGGAAAAAAEMVVPPPLVAFSMNGSPTSSAFFSGTTTPVPMKVGGG